MSTPSALTHPRAERQTGQFYPFSVTIKSMTGVTLLGPLDCNYDASTGGEPGIFEDEAPALDKILIPSWQPGIAPDSQAILDLAGTKKKFKIVDVLPQGNPPTQTLLIVSPT